MPTFKRFEDILAWQKTRDTAKLVYVVTDGGRFARDYGLRDQIRRASVSIMANIAEGFGRRSDKDFANFLNMAFASSAECQSHLYVAFDLEYLSKVQFDDLYARFSEISKMTISLSHHLRRSNG